MYVHTQCIRECINLRAAVVAVQDENNGKNEEITNEVWYSENQFNPLPLTSSLTLCAAIPAILATEQLYSPASLSVKLLITSCELPVLLMTLLPSPRRNTLPSFSQWTSGAGMPVKEHTSSKRTPSVWVIAAGKSTIVGLAVGENDIHMVVA